MARQIRIGMIGAGGIGRVQAEAVKAAGGRIVGVVDADPGRAENLANTHSADYAGNSVKKLVAIDEIDAVIIGTPNVYHASYTIAALRAGKHVFCEKPMATSATDCRAMIRAAKKARRILTVGYTRRFMPATEMVKAKVDAGELGTIYYAESKWFRRRGIPGYGGWFTTRRLSGGGPLIDLGCHMLDLVLWFLDHPRPTRVFATAGCHLANKDYTHAKTWSPYKKPVSKNQTRYDVEDYASAMIRFDTGVCMLLQTSWAINMSESERVETWLAGDRAGCVITDHVQFAGQEGGALTDTRYHLPDGKPFERQMAHFLDCVAKGKRPRVRPEQALMVQQILDAIYRSSRLRREVLVY